MATTTELPVSRPAKLQHRRVPTPVAAAVALVLTVAAALLFIAISRGLASAPSSH